MRRRQAGRARPARPSVPPRLHSQAVGRWRGCWRSWTPRQEQASARPALPHPWPRAREHWATTGGGRTR
eukprot:2826527-Alexandrium_andersonii.AAC.1